MRIMSVQIQNLRSFKNETVHFDQYTCVVGPNGAGKSNIFCALNIFFGEDAHSQTDLGTLDEEDFHNKDTSQPVRITVTFGDLSDAAKEDLKAYVRQNQLVVSAIAAWDSDERNAPVRQVGQRLVMKDFAQFFEAEKSGANATTLKAIFSGLRKSCPELKPATSKGDMQSSLRAFEEANPDRCELMESEDQFYGVSKGDHLLNRHIQWVFMPAVKDAATEHRESKDTALGKLLARTVRTKVSFKEKLLSLRNEMTQKYQEIMDQSQGELDGISLRLTEGLTQWASPDVSMGLEWHGDKEKSIKLEEPFAEIVANDGVFSGSLTRFGHGLQRSYLLALLQLIASGETTKDGPALILACEEPELFQHPPQARHLADVLIRLSDKENQIAVCTHNPLFVKGESFESVRLIRRDPSIGSSQVARCLATEVEGDIATARGKALPTRIPAIAKLEQELNAEINEIFFAPYIVLVEGSEDVSFIKAYLHKLDLMSRFRTLGCHIVPAHKKSMLIRPLAILRRMKVPFYCVFDADGDAKKEEHKNMHIADNRAILSLLGMKGVADFPSAHHWSSGLTIWTKHMSGTVADDFGEAPWKECIEAVAAANGHPSDIQKNSHFIPDFLAEAWSRGLASSNLEKLCREIISDAERRLARPVKPAKA